MVFTPASAFSHDEPAVGALGCDHSLGATASLLLTWGTRTYKTQGTVAALDPSISDADQGRFDRPAPAQAW